MSSGRSKLFVWMSKEKRNTESKRSCDIFSDSFGPT